MNNLDINPRIIASLQRAKLDDFGMVLSLSGPDIERATQLSNSDVKKLLLAVAEAVSKKPMISALNIYMGDCPVELMQQYLSTGCPVIDSFLKGGILSRGITEIAGESASGKTQFCMQLAITVQLLETMGGFEAGAVYICTEDVFPNKRLMQMVDLLKSRINNSTVRNHCFTDNIFIEHAADMDDLCHCIKKKVPVLLAQRRVKLVIIDSIAALYRCEFGAHETVKRAKAMSSFAAHLHTLSNKYNTAIVCINQVSDIINKESPVPFARHRIIPALGMAWANLVTCRFLLQRTNKHVNLGQITDISTEFTQRDKTAVRSMEVLFAPHLPNSTCYYIVDNEGVKGLS